ncbi:MAG: hypothetical protein ACO22D_02800 [Schleiferiaceae bacterium]
MFSKHSVLLLLPALWALSCAQPVHNPPLGYSEREVNGRTWYFPAISHWTPMDLMPIEEYQELVNESYLIDMAPIYGYTTKDGNCKLGMVVSVVSKYANEPYSEYDFLKRSPSEVHEMYVPDIKGDSLKVLASVYSVKYRQKITRVVLVHFQQSILGFELRNLSPCSKTNDTELVNFVKDFLNLNAL